MKGRYWHVSFDALDQSGRPAQGDLTYITDEKGMTSEHINGIKSMLKKNHGMRNARITFFGEMSS